MDDPLRRDVLVHRGIYLLVVLALSDVIWLASALFL